MQATRRDFLKFTTIGGAAAAIFGFDLQPAYAQLRATKRAHASSLVILPVSILERRILSPGHTLTAADLIVTSPPSPAREIFGWRARPLLQPGARLRSRF